MKKEITHSKVSSDILVYKYRTRGKKKKHSRYVKGEERLVNHLAKAGEAFFSKYNKVHDKSSRKKKDGWIRNFTGNLFKAAKAGHKKLKLKRIFTI